MPTRKIKKRSRKRTKRNKVVNPFFVFMSAYRRAEKREYRRSRMTVVAKTAGQMWRFMTQEEKQLFDTRIWPNDNRYEDRDGRGLY